MLRPPFISSKGVVASEHPLASAIGAQVLQRGGTAADAAVAVSLALSVTMPHLSGLGGDFFALLRDEDGHVIYVNGSGWAPPSLTAEDLRARGHSRPPLHGLLSAVLPGLVPALFDLHGRLGALTWKELVQPALRLAREGFPITAGLARALERALPWLTSSGAAAALLRLGKPPRPGDLLLQPALAATLSEVSEGGVAGFWRGRAGTALRRAYELERIALGADDLLSLRPEWGEALSLSYHGAKVYELPPNSLGPATLLLLKLLGQLGAGSPRPSAWERVRAFVPLARAAHAAALRELGDPRFVPFSLDAFLNAAPRPATGKGRFEGGDTTAFAIVDRGGTALVGIQSLYHHFGSRFYLQEAGFFLNNRARCFAEEGPNAFGPGKRPLHTLSAMLIERGQEIIALGISGGFLRPQQHALLASNLLEYGMSLGMALEHPRFLWDPEEEVLLVEEGIEVREEGDMPVRRLPYPSSTGVAQAVLRAPEANFAFCDIRGDGLPCGEA